MTKATRKILEALAAGASHATEIRDSSGESGKNVVPALHTHLQRLMSRGLVTSTGTGQLRKYRMTPLGKRHLWAMRVIDGDAVATMAEGKTLEGW